MNSVPDEWGLLRIVVSHPFASNHPTDEDLSAGVPEAKGWGTEHFWEKPKISNTAAGA